MPKKTEAIEVKKLIDWKDFYNCQMNHVNILNGKKERQINALKIELFKTQISERTLQLQIVNGSFTKANTQIQNLEKSHANYIKELNEKYGIKKGNLAYHEDTREIILDPAQKNNKKE